MIVELDVTNIDSSLIERFQYMWSNDDTTWKMKEKGYLRVTFLNGQVYIYEDVPFMIVMNIIAAQDSIGGRFKEWIKDGGYKYHKES